MHLATTGMFYQLLSIGPFPQKLAPKTSLQGPLWEIHAVNFLPFLMHSFSGSLFYVTDTGANLFQYADAVGLEFNRDRC